jgi:hypothetical protein
MSKLIEVHKERAKERQGERTDILANLPKGAEGEDNILPFPSDPVHVNAEIAKQAGVSPRRPAPARSGAAQLDERARPFNANSVKAMVE